MGYQSTLIEGFPAAVTATALRPNAKGLAIGLGDGTIWMCDPSSGKKQAELTGHRAAVFGLAFSLDGTRLVSAAKERMDPDLGAQRCGVAAQYVFRGCWECAGLRHLDRR